MLPRPKKINHVLLRHHLLHLSPLHLNFLLYFQYFALKNCLYTANCQFTVFIRILVAPKIGPRISPKCFHSNLKVTHSYHKSFSSTVVIMMFLMFTHDSPCFFSIFMWVGYPQQIKSIKTSPH